MPDNDIVSRVDDQGGITIKTECQGNMLHCPVAFNPTEIEYFMVFLRSSALPEHLQFAGEVWVGGSKKEASKKLSRSGRLPSESLYLPCGACEDMPCGRRVVWDHCASRLELFFRWSSVRGFKCSGVMEAHLTMSHGIFGDDFVVRSSAMTSW